MVSQADRELINNFVIELRPYLETVEVGVQEFAQPNRDGVIVGQAVQALMMIRGAGQILMVDGLVSISSWLVESFEKVQNNPDIAPAEASRRLAGLYNAMDDYLVALDRGDENVDGIVMRAKTIFEAIPAFGGPLPGTGKLRPRTDLDALFGEGDHAAQTRRISDDSADTEELAARQSSSHTDQTAEMPEAMPTVPLQRQNEVTQPVHEKVTQPSREAPARIVPIPPQPTEELPKVDPELREIFEEEALEIIAAFGDGIRELARNPGNREAIRSLNRAAHTLKGAANMTGFPLIAQIGAAIELLFDEQIERGQPVGRDVLELVAVSWKMLRAMIPNLNDLSSFTSPSNSIVQRAAVLREQLAQAHADAETIPMDERHYGARERDDRSAASTDEIVDIGAQAPQPQELLPEVDTMLVESAPTVPLRRDPVEPAPLPAPEPVVEKAAEAFDVPDPEPVAEIFESAAAATDEIIDPTIVEAEAPVDEVVIAEVPEPSIETPFWNAPETVDEPAIDMDAEVVEESMSDPAAVRPFWTEPESVEEAAIEIEAQAVEDTISDSVIETPFWGDPVTDEAPAAEATDMEVESDKPQSEPFWTPGTEELMRSAVGTDMLIADIQGLDDLEEEIAEAEAAEGFFTNVDAGEDVEMESAPLDDGSWLEEPDAPQTDLLNFDSTPQTEPFWNTLENLAQAEPFDMPEPEEVITMDPFFEPVDPDTSFLHQTESPAEVEAGVEVDAGYFVEPQVNDEDLVVEDAASAEPVEEIADRHSEPVDEVVEPAAIEQHVMAEAQPLDTIQPDELIEVPEPAYDYEYEAVASEPADEPESDYSYTYAFDFDEVEAIEDDTAPAEDILIDELHETPETGTEEFWTPEYVEAGDAEDAELVAEEPAVADEAAQPSFDSEVAGLIATAALESEPFVPEPFSAHVNLIAIDEQPAVEAIEIDPGYWEEFEALVPSYGMASVVGSIVTEFDAMPDDAELFEVLTSEPADDGVAEETDDTLLDEAVEAEEAAADDAVMEEEFLAEPESIEPFDSGAAMFVEEIGEHSGEDTVIEPFEMPKHENTSLEDTTEFATINVDESIEPEAMPVEATDEPVDIEDDIIVLDADSDPLAGFDDVVASIEGDDAFGDLDWFDEPEVVADETAEIAAGVDEAVEDRLPELNEFDELVEATAEPEPDQPATGMLSESGTSSLSSPTTDTLGFGSLDLESFLTTEGSIALSSALLDMAFNTQPEVVFDDGLDAQSISVFDESSERALEIEMFETFALEAEDHIATINRAAMQLDRDPLATEPLIDIKRALHTIKGAAAAADFMEISDLAHQLEDSLATHERLGTLHDRTFTSELFSGMEDVEAKLSRRKDELFGISEEEQSGGTLRIDVGRVDDLLNTVGELVVNRSSFEERLERLEATIEDLATAAARLQRSSYLLEREASSEDAIGRLLRGELSSREAGMSISDVQSEWDMLEMDRYTEFDRLIRQLAEVGADVSTAVGEINSLHGDFDTISNRQRRLTTMLQDELMGIRMVPISSLAPRLYRVVRRAAVRRGKDVSLIIEGGDTPFDKLLLDTLSESLLHLLRNSVDHGIEEINERRRLGKPEHGSIRIRAFRDGSEAVIEIIDDGAGIDHETVIRHARERGLAVADDITREEALLLIFEPGFTTKDEADDISGRGLGLEIVEQTVSRYKGRVAVDSVAGRGTVFSLRLPVMLSVIQAFLVSAGEGDFAVPVANIDYVVDRVDQPLTQIGDSVVVETANQIIPVVDVGVRIGRSQTPVIEKNSGWVMVTEIGGKRWALVVDELHGQQEIVVKPMGRFLRATPGLMGATILGHGDVALIVDVPALLGVDSLVTRLNKVSLTEAKAIADAPKTPDTGIGNDSPAHVVLVVDDSLSVRRVVSRTIERHGWVAILARDGVEALELLEQGQADIVLTDIEMPRMDGFDLISAIRSRSTFEELPIVVLTSRSGDKHRERALSLGANEYLVKPFQEQELVDVVENMSRTSSSV